MSFGIFHILVSGGVGTNALANQGHRKETVSFDEFAL
jgi:hypothetical protein